MASSVTVGFKGESESSVIITDYQNVLKQMEQIALKLRKMREETGGRREELGGKLSSATSSGVKIGWWREPEWASGLEQCLLEKLIVVEKLINELIDDIDVSWSLESLRKASLQCKLVLNKVEDALEDVEVELTDFYSCKTKSISI
ncbi:hypothetical protein WMY93_032131 [Mugilogobius chulae]|uniref:Uncharacterized protein n=1 Tax=Mugilogobius chulae TaxID=88201 RepID=A0AAW0MK43_9GOBI